MHSEKKEITLSSEFLKEEILRSPSDDVDFIPPRVNNLSKPCLYADPWQRFHAMLLKPRGPLELVSIFAQLFSDDAAALVERYANRADASESLSRLHRRLWGTRILQLESRFPVLTQTPTQVRNFWRAQIRNGEERNDLITQGAKANDANTPGARFSCRRVKIIGSGPAVSAMHSRYCSR